MHAALGDRLRQRERLRDRRLAAVERGIEAGDLRQLAAAARAAPGSAPDCAAGAAARAERSFSSAASTAASTRTGCGVLGSAVHDAVADADEPVLGEPLRAGTRRGGRARRRGRASTPSPHDFSSSVAPAPSLATKRGDVYKPSAWPRATSASASRAVGEQRELEARRAGVQDGDRVGHAVLRPRPCRPLRAARARPAPRCRRRRAASSPSRRGSSG